MSDNDVDTGAAPVSGDDAVGAADETAATDVKAAAAQGDAKAASSDAAAAVADAKPAAAEGDAKAVSSDTAAAVADAKPAAAEGDAKAVSSDAAATVAVAKPAAAEGELKAVSSADSTVDAKPAAAVTSWRDRVRIPGGAKGVVAARAAVAVALGAAVASTGYFFVQNQDNKALLEAHEEARTAACAYAPVLANYDAKNLDAYFAAVLDGATGDWKKQFDDTSRELKEVLTQGEVVSKANDVQCAVKSGDETSAEAIVVIGQTITSVGTQGKPAPGQLSMVMRMAKVDGKWLVNKVNSPLVPAPQQ
ncbi:hypothetical protein [Nocardia lijiangensis]|uniref:hypothetical protein n=1 Tax=Nocardia lijiangensis TaxID=299618 RepID=UPI000A8BCFB3|nr:hypothetical protein [Nocardia lijiangensis]